ncbi:uncharacterized protein [Neodiprion pinetum]|uniref:uncharacterized protein n=1 Tax=Neodiprion pinetum TaxID=441929 RepID=UPI003712219E
MRQRLFNCELAHIGDEAVKFYQRNIERNCSLAVRLATVWRPGTKLTKVESWLTNIKDFYGCPISVGTFTYLPKMVISENKNGSSTVIGGRDGMLLLHIAKRLNFTLVITQPSVRMDDSNYSRKSAITEAVASGAIGFAAVRLHPTAYLNSPIKLSVPHDVECLTWGVPHIVINAENIILTEFSWELWVVIWLVFSLTCGVAYVSMNKAIKAKPKRVGFMQVILDVLAIKLGNPGIYLTDSAGARLVLMSSVWYGMVVTTAYRACLGSILATSTGYPAITDSSGIIAANLTFGGSYYHYKILVDQLNIDNKSSSELVKRYRFYRNESEALHRLRFDHDFAYLARKSTLVHARQQAIRAQEPVGFDILNECVLDYNVVMAYPEGSFLLDPVDKTIGKLLSSGSLEVFDYPSDYVSDRISTSRTQSNWDYDERIQQKFNYVITFYTICLALCFVVFLMELLVPKLM